METLGGGVIADVGRPVAAYRRRDGWDTHARLEWIVRWPRRVTRLVYASGADEHKPNLVVGDEGGLVAVLDRDGEVLFDSAEGADSGAVVDVAATSHGLGLLVAASFSDGSVLAWEVAEHNSRRGPDGTRVVETWQPCAPGEIGPAPRLWLGSTKRGARLHAFSEKPAAFDLLPGGGSVRLPLGGSPGLTALAASAIEGRGAPVRISSNGSVDVYGWARPSRRAACRAPGSPELLAATFDAGDPAHAWALDARGSLVSMRAPSGSWLSCIATDTAERAAALASSPGRLVTAGCDGSLGLWVTQEASDAPKSVSKLAAAAMRTLLEGSGVTDATPADPQCSWQDASVAITTRAVAASTNGGRVVVGSELLTPPGYVAPATTSYMFFLTIFQGALLAVLLIALAVMHVKKKKRTSPSFAARMMAYERALKMPPAEGLGFVRSARPQKPWARRDGGDRSRAGARGVGSRGPVREKHTRSQGSAKAAAWVSSLGPGTGGRASAWNDAGGLEPLDEWTPEEHEEIRTPGDDEAEALGEETDL